MELCGLKPPEGREAPAKLEGHSLVPQLRDAKAARPWPAITTHGPGNHAVRTEGWRYIRYADGSEELYDESADPNEWSNLAKDPAKARVIRDLSRWLPPTSAPPAPGSKSRLIDYRDGVAYWEGKAIDPRASFPE